ncbi:MAG: hypothetical protein ACFE8E_12215 [Candidatus Hodarchaeota archaeon]
MSLGSVKVHCKKFNVKKELGMLRLVVNHMNIDEVSELRGFENKLKFFKAHSYSIFWSIRLFIE